MDIEGLEPSKSLTIGGDAEEVRFGDVIEAYRHFDRRESGWIKVALTDVTREKKPKAA